VSARSLGRGTRQAQQVAYFDAESTALEVIAPHLFGSAEERRLQDLLAN
jgi:hypothetical protein